MREGLHSGRWLGACPTENAPNDEFTASPIVKMPSSQPLRSDCFLLSFYVDLAIIMTAAAAVPPFQCPPTQAVCGRPLAVTAITADKHRPGETPPPAYQQSPPPRRRRRHAHSSLSRRHRRHPHSRQRSPPATLPILHLHPHPKRRGLPPLRLQPTPPVTTLYVLFVCVKLLSLRPAGGLLDITSLSL